MTCRTCKHSDVIDNEHDIFICTKYGDTVGGNNDCAEGEERDESVQETI